MIFQALQYKNVQLLRQKPEVVSHQLLCYLFLICQWLGLLQMLLLHGLLQQFTRLCKLSMSRSTSSEAEQTWSTNLWQKCVPVYLSTVSWTNLYFRLTIANAELGQRDLLRSCYSWMAQTLPLCRYVFYHIQPKLSPDATLSIEQPTNPIELWCSWGPKSTWSSKMLQGLLWVHNSMYFWWEAAHIVRFTKDAIVKEKTNTRHKLTNRI